ncbi:hypothetical protein BS47DRAFT_1332147 [Hydnum rufescens UP504]|uniref:DUF202 domain-containing protein n=1 Tax=Hydnum rufescens UP504 TaxID=1448309 RepID=A0A9P6AQN9_9AGAM|nr:hypothetical protein BS47DRAFT_1332147 [Hydnum rufescens UP504]
MSGIRERESSVDGIIRRSMHAVSDLFSPFSSSALASLPQNPRGIRDRSTRTDNIPDPEPNAHSAGHHRDYQSISGTLPTGVRIPKKIATPIMVEAKVWFANERTWISYLNLSILLGGLALALFNASRDEIARMFAVVYATIGVGVLGQVLCSMYGYIIYQRRVSMIRKRDPGNFDEVVGPVIISALLFFAVLSNFLLRVRELFVNRP